MADVAPALTSSSAPGPDADPQRAVEYYGDRYRANPKAAEQLIRVGEGLPAAGVPPADLAAWTMVGNLVLNLDEVVSR